MSAQIVEVEDLVSLLDSFGYAIVSKPVILGPDYYRNDDDYYDDDYDEFRNEYNYTQCEEDDESEREIPLSLEMILPSPEECRLREALEEWRLAKMKSGEVRPSDLPSVKSLRRVAKQRPMTKEDLLNVYGFGPFRVDLFFDDIVEILKRESQDVSDEVDRILSVK